MKNYIYKTTVTLLLATLIFSSCSVDDYKVQGELTDKTFIENEASARSVLNGIYENARPNGDRGVFRSVLFTIVAGLEQKRNPETLIKVLESFEENSVRPNEIQDRTGLFRLYKSQFGTINLANIFINTIEEKGIDGASQETQNAMLAEAKALRANAYFMLLRVFGQFFDNSSEYGVPTTEKFIDAFTYLKRAKVSETYDQIIKDLEYALQYTSDSKDKVYITKTFVKALLAKVYLYRGGTDNWTKTVTYCKDIIDNLGDKFRLSDTYSSIYKESFKGSEVIFAPFYSKSEDIQNNPMAPTNVTPSDYFKNLANEMVSDITVQVEELDDYGYPTGNFINKTITRYDPRFQFTFGEDENYEGYTYKKYPDSNSTFYFLRVSEIYLMYAEALVRTGGDMQVAVDSVNKIRERAYEGIDFKYYDNITPTLVTFTDKAKLLEDIRKEKMLELHLETGESWFDLVRYDRLGNLKIANLKPTIASDNKLIFPIPLRVKANNPKFGPQNPGY